MTELAMQFSVVTLATSAAFIIFKRQFLSVSRVVQYYRLMSALPCSMQFLGMPS
jgi:hypothetical protein